MINLFGTTYADCPGEGIANDFLAKSIALAFRELLAVVEAGVGVVGRKDNRCGIDWTGKTTASCLVCSSLDEPLGVV